MTPSLTPAAHKHMAPVHTEPDGDVAVAILLAPAQQAALQLVAVAYKGEPAEPTRPAPTTLPPALRASVKALSSGGGVAARATTLPRTSPPAAPPIPPQ